LLTGAVVLRDFDRAARSLVREHSVARMVDAYQGHYERLLGLMPETAGTCHAPSMGRP
jgi:hypothetical protein